MGTFEFLLPLVPDEGMFACLTSPLPLQHEIDQESLFVEQPVS